MREGGLWKADAAKVKFISKQPAQHNKVQKVTVQQIFCWCQLGGRLIVLMIWLKAGQQEIYLEKLVYSFHPVSNGRKRMQKIKKFWSDAYICKRVAYANVCVIWVTSSYCICVCVRRMRLDHKRLWIGSYSLSIYLLLFLHMHTFAWSLNRA